MASPRFLGGYPVRVTNLKPDDMLFFNGKEWTNVDRRIPNPETFELDEPSFTGEQIVVFDGLPVLMANLEPGDIMAVINYDITPKSEGAVAESFVQECYTNISWSLVFSDVEIKPESEYAANANSGLALTAARPTRSYDIVVE